MLEPRFFRHSGPRSGSSLFILCEDPLAEVPPKTHNLVFLAEKLKIQLPEYHYDFIFMLSGLSIPTRYPDDLQKLLKDYSKGKTGKVLEQAKEVLKTSRVCGFRTCQNNKRMDVPSYAL